MNERVGHNTVIKNDLEDAGFDVRWSLKDGLIVSLQRHLAPSEVRTALFDAGYEDGMFAAYGNGHWVIVDAVC